MQPQRQEALAIHPSAAAVDTPRDAGGRVEYNAGWKLWSDMARFYPSGVHRRRVIGEWLAPLAPSTVLDAGCGPGHLLAHLRSCLPLASLTGVDQADATIAENRHYLPWARFEPLDLERHALPERFEAVVCSEVLEHIGDDQSALEHLVSMTGRYLMLTIPTGTLMPLEAGFGHLRHYQLETLCGRIRALGLTIRRAEAWGFPFMNLFKWAANLRPQATLAGFGDGEWSWPKKAFGAALTGLFHVNLAGRGPQLFILAERS